MCIGECNQMWNGSVGKTPQHHDGQKTRVHFVAHRLCTEGILRQQILFFSIPEC